MTTITATELRKNLDDVLLKVSRGQEIVVTHRFRGSVKLSAAYAKPQAHKRTGLEAFFKATKLAEFDFDVNRPLKELYRESMAKKYGIK